MQEMKKNTLTYDGLTQPGCIPIKTKATWLDSSQCVVLVRTKHFCELFLNYCLFICLFSSRE